MKEISAEQKNIISNPVFLIQTGIIFVLMYFMYRKTVAIVISYWYQPAYSHGFIIPFLCAYFVWEERERFALAEIKPAKNGLLILVFSILVYALGRIGAERFISALSLVFVLSSIIYYHLGKDYFKILRFPIFLFIFAIPIPNMIFQNLSFNLQLFSSEFAVRFMQLFDLPVYNEGNIIHLFYTDLEVAEACSGIHSIISLLTLSVVFAYYFQRNNKIRTLLVLSSLPIAVITNAFRVAGTGILAHYWSIKAAKGFFHEFSGWLIFVVAFFILVSENLIINRIRKK